MSLPHCPSARRRATGVAGIALALILASCGQPRTSPVPARVPVVLVSIDGLRYDYLDRYPSPNLHRLIAEGVRAPMVPVFPSKTFPNHYTIVTGLFPAHHGVVDNTMYDPAIGSTFRLSDSAAQVDPRWWGGEPLWVTAEKQGRIAASYFWPGSEAPIEGIRPSEWRHYDGKVPNADRVRQVLQWLRRPAGERPDFVTLYFDEVDHAAHVYGPDSPEARTALWHVDSVIGMLMDGVKGADGRPAVNVVIVSDHGMSPISPDSVVALDEYLDLSLLERITGGNPLLGLWPKSGTEQQVLRALQERNPHLSVWSREEIPARFHYRGNPRIPPVLALAAPGWSVTLRRRDVEQNPARFTGGQHGYDDTVSVMRASFIAAGPAFREGYVSPPFRNIHVYDLITGILGLRPAPNDGSPDSTAAFLRRPASGR